LLADATQISSAAHLTLTVYSVWVWFFTSLAIALLISGLDDFIPICICLRQWLLVARQVPERPLLEATAAARRIAIFVPCWKESAVIGNMVRHNLAAIRYNNYDFFLGTYPNDEPTVREARQLSAVFPNVHVAVCERPGPTSKADCLNTVFHGMTVFETENDTHFDTIVLHDAEDMIHPDALSLINRERCEFEMVQVPVLPLPTPLHEFTHGVYCDEFAEFQTIDMHARQYSNSFVPSNGVGTGFAREILDRLALERGEIFDAASLTEDYEIGVYIHASKFRQKFAPLIKVNGSLVATREYFPRTLQTAIRQRTRWVTGIALQCWERRGWRGGWRTKYWFWRDRKGLVASPLSLLTNLLFLAGLADWGLSTLQHRPWMFAINNPRLMLLCLFMLLLQCFRIALRMICVGRIFGARFALGVPLRIFHGNLINCFASLRAVWRYAEARRNGKAHVWLKTEHAYPNRDALIQQRGEFSAVLLQSRIVTEQQLADLRPLLSDEFDLGIALLSRGIISEEELCRARSLHAGVVYGRVEVKQVKLRVVRSLPRHVAKRFAVLPVSIQEGRLLIAGADIPEPALFEELRLFTALPVDFQLVTKTNFDEIAELAYAPEG
jgi:adsorption protein B